MDKLKVILTGATGMVGEGVLYECLQHPNIEKVLVIARKPCGYTNSKLTEIIHNNFFDISSLSDRLKGYNACFFCLGSTSFGSSEAEYTKVTYTLTVSFATMLSAINPDMCFSYISGAGTDTSEKTWIMWARVKGKTENALMKLPFKKVYNFRPAGIIPYLPLRPGQTFYKTYKYIGWLLPLIGSIAPNAIIDLKDLAKAMINVTLSEYHESILEVKDIKRLAK